MPEEEPKYKYKDLRDLVVIFIAISLLFAFFSIFDLFDEIRIAAVNPEGVNYIQLMFVIALFSLAAGLWSLRRWRELRKELRTHIEAEKDLRENESRLLTTVDLSPDAITIHRDSKIIFINRAGVTLFGAASQDAMIGKDIRDFIHHDFIDIVLDRIARLNRGDMKVPNIELKIKRIDNLIVDVEVASTPITYHEIPHIITILRDITERKHASARLKESEERLQSILDNSTAVVFLKDINGQYLLVNKQFEKTFNITRERIRWRTDHDIFPAELADNFRTNDKKVLETRQPLTVEEIAPHEDGLHTYISVKFPLYNSVGFPYAVCGIATDITERKRAEEARSRLASIVAASDDAIVSYDLDGTILTWNPGAEKIYGYSSEEMLGKSIALLVPSENKNEISEILKKIKWGERFEHYEAKRVRKDGKIIYVSLSVSPIKDDEGNVTSASSISRDVTEKKRTEEELKRYAEELALSNEELYVFSYAASHDLQDPLRNVEQFITSLQKSYGKKMDRRFKKQIDAAEDGVLRMSRLINDFLAYSRVGTEKAKYEQTDLNGVVKDAVANLKTIIHESKAKVIYKNLPSIYCNPLHMTAVFQNLLSNSIKYKGEKHPQIRINSERRNGEWLFSVADNGQGIEPWYHERIFLLFFKMHDPKKYPGSGIGLALCKRVIEKHGGKIWLESEKGKGSTFYFTIPENSK